MQGIVENSIENLRKSRGLTQEELALVVNVTRQTIIALEKGNYTPSVLLAMKIAQFFRVPIEKVFTIKKS
jgi:putative transcriptional regulator